MGRKVVVMIGLLTLTGCQAAPEGTAGEARDEATVEEAKAAITSLFEAMNAHEPDRIVEYYDGSPEFTYVGCTRVRTGFESHERVLRAWDRNNPDASFAPEILSGQALGPDAAVVAASANTSEGARLYWTWVLERSGDRWLVVHEHESWADCPPSPEHPPMVPMDSGAATAG